MTAPTLEQRTVAFEDGWGQPASSDFAAPGAEQFDEEADSAPSPPPSIPSMPGFPVELKQALRAARTPLIEGVDFKPAANQPDPPPESTQAEVPQLEKPRVDTLSPLESVPPPAPYLAAPLPARPSVVPPVRSPYIDPQNARARSDPPPRGIHSDPPPNIPISDRPSRIAYRSDPPPRHPRSDPPPQSSGPAPTNRRQSRNDFALGVDRDLSQSPEALRRDAVTIPADARSPAQPTTLDASKPLPALRAPTFSPAQLPYAMRQHENNQLRNVAMAMMFVIFIVTGAIAGMKWFVARADEHAGPRSATTSFTLSRAPRDTPKPASATKAVDPHSADSALSQSHKTQSEPQPTKPPTTVSKPPVKPPSEHRSSTKNRNFVSMPDRNPWDEPTATSSGRRSTAKPRPGATARGPSKPLNPKDVDTQTPLILSP